MSFQNTFKKSEYYHWFYPLAAYTKLDPRDSSKRIPIFVSVRPKEKKNYYLEAETQRTAKPQTYTSEKIKVFPDKVGRISLMCGYWAVSFIHFLINMNHSKNQYYNK